MPRGRQAAIDLLIGGYIKDFKTPQEAMRAFINSKPESLIDLFGDYVSFATEEQKQSDWYRWAKAMEIADSDQDDLFFELISSVQKTIDDDGTWDFEAIKEGVTRKNQRNVFYVEAFGETVDIVYADKVIYDGYDSAVTFTTNLKTDLESRLRDQEDGFDDVSIRLYNATMEEYEDGDGNIFRYPQPDYDDILHEVNLQGTRRSQLDDAVADEVSYTRGSYDDG